MNNEDRGNREKKEEKLGTSISNHEISFLKLAFAILVTFKSLVIRLKALVLCQKIKNSPNCVIYGDKCMKRN